MINAAGIRHIFRKTKVLLPKLYRRRKVFGLHSNFISQRSGKSLLALEDEYENNTLKIYTGFIKRINKNKNR